MDRRNDGKADIELFSSGLVIATVLAAVLVLSILSVGTAAAQEVEVSSLEELREVSSEGEYVLVADIDASEAEGFEPIGDDDEPFVGTFDGGGHTITGLTVNRPEEENVGLFGYVGSDGTVANLGVEDVEVTGGGSVGGIVGQNEGELLRSHATGSVEGGDDAGGLVGRNLEEVSESYADVRVSGGENVGGLTGRNGGAARVSESYALGSVEGEADVGGAVGDNAGEVTDTYARANVEADRNVGGLVGTNSGTVERTYSAGTVSGGAASGGLIGDSKAEVTDSYWDSEVAGQGSSSGGVPMSTEDMTGSTAMGNMDFEFGETWEPGEDDYPVLAWQVHGYGGPLEMNAPPPGAGEDEEEEENETTNETEEYEPPDEGLPGFGVLATVAAVLVGGGLMRRRKERRR